MGGWTGEAEMGGGPREEGRPQPGHGGRACLACGEGGGALWV